VLPITHTVGLMEFSHYAVTVILFGLILLNQSTTLSSVMKSEEKIVVCLIVVRVTYFGQH